MAKTVLIVDDQLVNRRLLNKILSSSYTCLEAADGAAALEVLQQHGKEISAVLLDLVMPGVDGYEVLRRMGQSNFLSRIPVIVVSQADKDETESKALELGARDFLSKPYNPQVIRRRLSNLIELYEANTSIETIERDELTGLYSKAAFCRHAARIMEDNLDTEYMVVATDIERFKLVNDTYGTKEGDHLLQYLAGCIKKEVRAAGGICARHNADHFVALVPAAVDDGHLKSVILSTEKDLGQYPLDMRITLKFGVYPVTEKDVPPDIMCDRAILAAESVKGNYNSACAYYDDSIRQRLLREQLIANEMKTALAEGQFKVYLQPKYDLQSEKIAGAEALVRWIHPKMGFMNPGEFIPLFEENGFITELDKFVWEETCSIISEWISEGKKYVPVSVNVSRKDIYQENLPVFMGRLVQKYGLRPNQLHLEITESAYTEHTDQLIGVVSELKSMGFVIEMDDFGSGYSSLNMLSEMPIDILKLDMRFIQQETARNSSRNILSFIISLAKWMNLLVIAEGVETQEQIDLLRNMECNYVQGYYYAKPMPSKEFTGMVLSKELASPIVVNEKDWNAGSVQRHEATGDKTMLIVDDVELNRTILSEFFQSTYTIVEADNGQVAFRYIQEHFDELAVIMLDLIMPVMDGFQVLEKLRENPMYASIPVVVTSQAGETSEARAFELGASDFLPKPYNMDIALHRVQNVTARNAVQTLEREKRMLAKMKKLALEAKLDQLTGLYNRMEMEHQVRDYFGNEHAGKALFLMLDIDNFKSINDTYGHDRGDEAIQKVADILQECFREDDIVCRMGGDEFAVFMKADLSEVQIEQRLSSLQSRLHFKVDGSPVSCSIGACAAPDFGRDYQELYHNADVALLSAKRQGKNQYKLYGGGTVAPEQFFYRNMDWLLDESSDAVFICDAQTYELYYINEVGCGMAGKPKQECVGQPCYKALWNRESPCTHCVHINKMTHDYCEHEVQPEGTDNTYIIKGKLIDWGSRGARIQYVQDNTSRANLMHKMEAVSRDRQQILDLLPGGVFRFKQADNHFDFVGENLLRMLGYTRSEFDRTFNGVFNNLVWREDRQRADTEVRYQLAQGDYYTCQYRIQKKDGTLCWVYDTGHLNRTAEGGEFYVMLTDITRMKKIEEENRMLAQEVQEHRDVLAAAMEHSGLTYWLYDFSKNAVLLSPETTGRTGLPAQLTPELQRKLAHTAFDEHNLELYRGLLNGLRSGQERTQSDLELLNREDGRHHWLRIMCTVISRDGHGQPLKALCTCRDVAEEKRLQQVVDSLIDTEFDVICLLDAQTGAPEVLRGDGLQPVLAEQRRLHDPAAGVAAHLSAACVPEDRERAVRETGLPTVLAALEKNTLYSVYYRLQTPDGVRRKRADYRYLDESREALLCTIQDMVRFEAD